MSDEKVAKLAIKREEGFTYWIKGDAVVRKKEGGTAEEVAKSGITQDKNYLYFLDADGDISRSAKGGAKPEPAASGSPVTFAAAYAPLKAHAGEAVFAKVKGRKQPITIFDWSSLEEDDQEFFAESQVYSLAEALGGGWSKKLVPFALVGGESHPVPLDELDQQTDGVLLVELATGAVVYCEDASTEKAKKIADSTSALEITSQE
jgi:hypothetical protein